MIFDTHAHYDDEAFDEDRDAVLTSLCEKGVSAVVNICASPGTDRNVFLCVRCGGHSPGSCGGVDRGDV